LLNFYNFLFDLHFFMDLLNGLWLLFDNWFNVLNVFNVFFNCLDLFRLMVDDNLYHWLNVYFNVCYNFLGSFFNFNWSLCGHCAAEVLSSIGKLAKLCLDLVVLLGNERIFLLLEVDAELVVDKRDDHAVVERDEVGGLMLGDLVKTLHKHESSVR